MCEQADNDGRQSATPANAGAPVRWPRSLDGPHMSRHSFARRLLENLEKAGGARLGADSPLPENTAQRIAQYDRAQ
jgi:hypothetical protein